MDHSSADELELLRDINRDLPNGIDWKAGAREYVQQVLRESGGGIESYLFTKPFAILNGGADDKSHATFVDLFANFLNVFSLLKLPAGSRILDVACGSGWLSHFLSRLGYDVVGIDISDAMIEFARRRLKEDRFILKEPAAINEMFMVHDIEECAPEIGQPVDAVICESCLHHFVNPVAALRNLARILSPMGLVALIEGENRTGGIKAEYMNVMQHCHTVERPYTRSQLTQALTLAGLPAYEFFCPVNGWFSPRPAHTKNLQGFVAKHTDQMNRGLAAKCADALRRVLPWWPADATIDFVTGFSEGMGSKLWSAPFSMIRLLADVRQLVVEIGGWLPGVSGGNQEISIYAPDGTRSTVVLTPSRPSTSFIYANAVAGSQFCFCSDAAFSPAWQGASDSRVLSFWIDATAAVACRPKP
jgi:2-polyprenyl-3-methyl-5-hydroxy-6-metoxy-1,4-benzoquinol methylase